MNENESSIYSMMVINNKKHYTSPKIEVIGDIKHATRGLTGSGLDGGTFSGPPTDVSGGVD
jgi:hypothetical protein